VRDLRTDLVGCGWGEWNGAWSGHRCLVSRGGGWSLEEGGLQTGRWRSLTEAVLSLWPGRQARDRSPWAIGWIGYEEAARLAGGLPYREGADLAPGGWLLLEPEVAPGTPESDSVGTQCPGRARWSLDSESYRQGVEAVRSRIGAGDVYQVNLCRRLTVEGFEGSLQPFADVASDGGVPDYLAHIDFGDGELLCASMEMLLRRQGEELETRPIKGTRPRGTSPEEDLKLAAELDADTKERAELAMVVDLERNDLGRICEVGSVEVTDPGSVEAYAAVHHRVARVTGRVGSDFGWWEAMASMAPGGSVTGCPKHAAMTLIQKLEPVPRGPFTGVLGVVAGNGDLEMALPIRTAWRIGATLEFAAGCGIVWQSDPVAEERESRLKIARWLDLVGMAE
jgi:anthranilate/para-aminobenzoate synthase component I